MAFQWTDEAVATLKKLWAEGASAAKIAASYDGPLPTRSAVIGKVHRLGLSGRATTSRYQQPRARTVPRAAKPRRPKPAPTPLQAIVAALPVDHVESVEEIVIPVAERKTLDMLADGDCRWPIGDPQDPEFHFCAKPKAAGLPYCERHAVRAYVPYAPKTAKERPFVLRGHPGTGTTKPAAGGPSEARETAFEKEGVE